MAMSKQDFMALANTIKDHNRIANHPANSDMVKFTPEHLAVIAAFCKSQNSNFMKDRWMGYIEGTNGPSGGSVRKVA